MKTFALILAFALLGPGDGDKKGRRANAMYRAEQFAEASILYRDALLDVQTGGPGSTHSGLLNNLGASLFKQGDYEQAISAFTGAARMASNTGDGVRATYNAGNAAAMQDKLEAALDMYTRTLLADPSNEDAKFNYEFVKRKLKEQQEQEQQQQQGDSQDENQEQQDQNQDQKDQKQSQDQDQKDQKQNQQEQDRQNQNSEDQPPSEERPQRNPEELTREEAERLLQALENEEIQLLRQIQKMDVRARRVEKDW